MDMDSLIILLLLMVLVYNLVTFWMTLPPAAQTPVMVQAPYNPVPVAANPSQQRPGKNRSSNHPLGKIRSNIN